MRVLLDECRPRGLKRAIIGHEVSTVPKMGWAGFLDRDVLETAATHFDAFITVDRVVSGQPASTPPALAVIVLVAQSNRLSDLMGLIPKIRDALETIQPGQVIRITN